VSRSEIFMAKKLEDSSPELLGYDVMKSCVRIPTFRTGMPPATSG
jgi:hypothetical protein